METKSSVDDTLIDLFRNVTLARSSSNLDDQSKDRKKAEISSAENLKQFKMLLGSKAAPYGQLHDNLSTYSTIAQFKKNSFGNLGLGRQNLISSKNEFLAYCVSDKKIRIHNLKNDGKLSIERPQGSIQCISWSPVKHENKLYFGFLSVDGEVTIGRIHSGGGKGDEGFSFETTSVLTFPEIGPAKGICWNVFGKDPCTVVFGSGSEVFFIHFQNYELLNPKISFITSSIETIQNVLLSEKRAIVVGNGEAEELVSDDGFTFKSFGIYKLFNESVWMEAFVYNQGTILIMTCNLDDSISFFEINNGVVKRISSLLLETEDSIDSLCLRFDQISKVAILFDRSSSFFQAISLKNPKRPIILNEYSDFVHNVIDLSFLYLDETTLDETFVEICTYGSNMIQNHKIKLTVELATDVESLGTELEDLETEQSEIEYGEEESNSLESKLIKIIDLKFDMIRSEIVKDLTKNFLTNLNQEMKGFTEILVNSLNITVARSLEQMNHSLMELLRESDENGVNSASIKKYSLPSSNSVAEIGDLLKSQKYTKALIMAANLNEPKILMEVCRSIDDPFPVLDSGEVPQKSLVSIFKILAQNIEVETDVKLNWIQEVLIQLDLEDDKEGLIKLSEVVDFLFGKLKLVLADRNSDGNIQKQAKIVMRLLRKFQMQ